MYRGATRSWPSGTIINFICVFGMPSLLMLLIIAFGFLQTIGLSLQFVGQIWSYVPKANAWFLVSPKYTPSPRSRASGSVYDDSLVVFGMLLGLSISFSHAVLFSLSFFSFLSLYVFLHLFSIEYSLLFLFCFAFFDLHYLFLRLCVMFTYTSGYPHITSIIVQSHVRMKLR